MLSRLSPKMFFPSIPPRVKPWLLPTHKRLKSDLAISQNQDLSYGVLSGGGLVMFSDLRFGARLLLTGTKRFPQGVPSMKPGLLHRVAK